MSTESKTFRVFFGHQSVGADMLAGLKQLRGATAGVPDIVEVAEHGPTQSSLVLVHGRLGTNGDPGSKLVAFQQSLNSPELASVDVAILKFCYVDLTTMAAAKSLVSAYGPFMDALAERHSRLRIAHCTIPLRRLPNGPYASLRRSLGHRHPQHDANLAREWFNDRIRSDHLGRGNLFDLALLESTRRDGRRCLHEVGGDRIPSLAPEWTSDGGHLNESGRKMVANAFLKFLSALGTH